ncbi:MAG: 50S ribosomal protein L6 [Clostridia bacterium]|jgi:large subunit ribosomal protein L6|nr:50S ribosomal protein L6 [Clostridia bacterium]
MSRIGNSPILVPEGVEVNVQGNHVSVKGPKGTLERDINEKLVLKIEDGKIIVERPNDETEMKSLHGLTRTLINNMVIGVKEEYSKELQVNGVGYRVQKQGNDLNLNLGYSHPVIYKAPQGISFDVPNPNTIIVKGIDKELVGQTAAEIRTKRLPEVYGGKGIKYSYEVIRRKEGKTGKK